MSIIAFRRGKRLWFTLGVLVIFAVAAAGLSTLAEAKDTIPTEVSTVYIETSEGDIITAGTTRPPCNATRHCHPRATCWWQGGTYYCVEFNHCHTHCSQ